MNEVFIIFGSAYFLYIIFLSKYRVYIIFVIMKIIYRLRVGLLNKNKKEIKKFLETRKHAITSGRLAKVLVIKATKDKVVYTLKENVGRKKKRKIESIEINDFLAINKTLEIKNKFPLLTPYSPFFNLGFVTEDGMSLIGVYIKDKKTI